jgi:predicted nucleic acid-binding protein
VIVLADTNVILDVLTDDPVWYSWSVTQLNNLALSATIAINDVIYAELAPGFLTFEELEAAVGRMTLELRPMPRAALFLASRAFDRYRNSAGQKTGVLPDFFIGAQASIERLPLVTRDTSRYRTYFPQVELIAP